MNSPPFRMPEFLVYFSIKDIAICFHKLNSLFDFLAIFGLNRKITLIFIINDFCFDIVKKKVEIQIAVNEVDKNVWIKKTGYVKCFFSNKGAIIDGIE